MMPIQRQSDSFGAFNEGTRWARDRVQTELPKGLAALINTSGPRITGGMLNTRTASEDDVDAFSRAMGMGGGSPADHDAGDTVTGHCRGCGGEFPTKPGSKYHRAKLCKNCYGDNHTAGMHYPDEYDPRVDGWPEEDYRRIVPTRAEAEADEHDFDDYDYSLENHDPERFIPEDRVDPREARRRAPKRPFDREASWDDAATTGTCRWCGDDVRYMPVKPGDPTQGYDYQHEDHPYLDYGHPAEPEGGHYEDGPSWYDEDDPQEWRQAALEDWAGGNENPDRHRIPKRPGDEPGFDPRRDSDFDDDPDPVMGFESLGIDGPRPRGWSQHYYAGKGKCDCWEGYERVPGTKPCAEGSCRKCDSHREAMRLASSTDDVIRQVRDATGINLGLTDAGGGTYVLDGRLDDGSWLVANDAEGYHWGDMEERTRREREDQEDREEGEPPAPGHGWSVGVYRNNGEDGQDTWMGDDSYPIHDHTDYDARVDDLPRVIQHTLSTMPRGRRARLAGWADDNPAFNDIMKHIDEQLAAGEPSSRPVNFPRHDHSDIFDHCRACGGDGIDAEGHDCEGCDGTGENQGDPYGTCDGCGEEFGVEDLEGEADMGEYCPNCARDREAPEPGESDLYDLLSGRDGSHLRDVFNGKPVRPSHGGPEGTVKWERSFPDDHYASRQAALPVQPPVVGAHGFQPAHRVGLPWRDQVIPGTVIGLDGPNVAVRWDDGQYSTEEPHNINLL